MAFDAPIKCSRCVFRHVPPAPSFRSRSNHERRRDMVNSLETFAHAVSADWGPLSTELIDGVRQHLERLLRAPATEGWLDTLHRDAPPSHEMYRDPGEGFVLLAHTEPTGLYRPPHDHGRSWVIYGVQ